MTSPGEWLAGMRGRAPPPPPDFHATAFFSWHFEYLAELAVLRRRNTQSRILAVQMCNTSLHVSAMESLRSPRVEEARPTGLASVPSQLLA